MFLKGVEVADGRWIGQRGQQFEVAGGVEKRLVIGPSEGAAGTQILVDGGKDAAGHVGGGIAALKKLEHAGGQHDGSHAVRARIAFAGVPPGGGGVQIEHAGVDQYAEAAKAS